MKTGIDLITEERKRQIEVEGWTPEHDDEHIYESLATAAACYALPNYYRNHNISNNSNQRNSLLNILWQWHPNWWKPTPENRVKELIKAGALIAAEIDRLQAGG